SRYFGDLQGVVRNSQNGLPIPKVNIFTVPASQSVTTDDIGQYKIKNIAIGEYVVTAEKAGYDTVNISVVIQAGQITEADFFLTEVDTSTPPTTGMIEGTVRDAQTGALVSGVVLSTDPTTDVVTTSADGSFSFEKITPGEYTISATKTGYQNANASVTVTAGNTTRADIVLTQSFGSITGVVKDAATELPIQGANIQTDPATSSVTTDSDGRYEIKGITPNSYKVKASKTGYADAEIPVVVTAGNETAADIPMQPGK
ncbi:MAG: PEGA domain-containing protein, partial [Chlorobi bacterium]|nr:PEGA domain-containing protein [Chlorobiota bacterium]